MIDGQTTVDDTYYSAKQSWRTVL